uniref:Interferon lambda receptor 1 n=1 Tax=Sinocyclocheilus grahami TaxID=75366 RepID=A0A672N842_SINGR
RTKAYFESWNFFSVLHWDPVDVPGQTLLYTKHGWTFNISTPVCDMTDVMTHVMSDVTSKYHAKVSASGQCLAEVMFKPFWQTTFAAPQLSVTSNQTHLNVTVLPQMTAWSCSIENISFWGKGFQRPSIKYTVRLTHPKSLAGKVFEDTSRSVFIWLVETDEQYCGDVLYTLTHPGRSSPSENASFCVTVSGDSQSVLLSPLYVKQILQKISSLAFYSDFRDDTSEVEVWSGFDEKLEPQAVFAARNSEIMGNESSYASQDHCDHEWRRNQPDVPVQNSPGSSVHYSVCSPCQISIEPSSDDTTDETSSDSFGPESESVLIHHFENSSGPLVVPVRPAENGQLQFHDLLFQRDTGQSSPVPSQDSEGLTGERTPLLSDLIQNNSSDLPVHVSDVVTSNYRQNWLPGIPLEGQRDQRTYVMRTDHLWMVEMQGLSLPCN